jgi:hypothetical protein
MIVPELTTHLGTRETWPWVIFIGGPIDGMRVQRVVCDELRYDFYSELLRHVYFYGGEHDGQAEFYHQGAWPISKK